jgi:hypothetical protein
MTTDTLRVQAPRLVLVNLATNEELEAWANPPTLTEQRSAQWTRIGVPGLGHQPLQFGGTANRRVPDVELTFDRRTHPNHNIEAARVFLDALVAPVSAPGPAAPPRVLLVWPRLLSVEAIADSVELVHQHLAVDGALVAMTAKLAFEQVLDVRQPEAGGR